MAPVLLLALRAPLVASPTFLLFTDNLLSYVAPNASPIVLSSLLLSTSPFRMLIVVSTAFANPAGAVALR